MIHILNLGISDSDRRVKGWGVNYLKEYLFFDYEGMPEEYQNWFEKNKDFTYQEIQSRRFKKFLKKLKGTSYSQIGTLLDEFEQISQSGVSQVSVEPELLEILKKPFTTKITLMTMLNWPRRNYQIWEQR